MKLKKSILALRDPDPLTEEAEKLFYNNRITTLAKEYQDNPHMKKKALEIIETCNYNCVYLYGNVGTGKTTVATQMIRLIWDRGISGKFIDYPEWDSMLESEKRKYNNKADEKIIMLKEFPGVLLLDDFIFDHPSPQTRSTSHIIINHRSTNGLVTIITSNIKINEVVGIYDPKLASRLVGYCGGEVIIKGKDHRNVASKKNNDK